MLRAFALALGQLLTPSILGLLGLCTLLSLGCLAGLWFGLDLLLDRWLGELTDRSTWLSWLGGALTLVLSWFLFPVLAMAFVGLFLDHVAKLVERRHYPHLPKAEGLTMAESVAATVRFLATLVAANALLLGLLVVMPVAYPFGWLVTNGCLVGREYFELVAMRRLSTPDADALRRRRAAECLLTGIAITLLLTVPVVNLVAPILATAVMVHRYHDWQSPRGAVAGGSANRNASGRSSSSPPPMPRR
ncbi:MAG: EI24 domain-containing protein [Planctomycetota bacterium]